MWDSVSGDRALNRTWKTLGLSSIGRFFSPFSAASFPFSAAPIFFRPPQCVPVRSPYRYAFTSFRVSYACSARCSSSPLYSTSMPFCVMLDPLMCVCMYVCATCYGVRTASCERRAGSFFGFVFFESARRPRDPRASEKMFEIKGRWVRKTAHSIGEGDGPLKSGLPHYLGS